MINLDPSHDREPRKTGAILIQGQPARIAIGDKAHKPFQIMRRMFARRDMLLLPMGISAPLMPREFGRIALMRQLRHADTRAAKDKPKPDPQPRQKPKGRDRVLG